jgi:hypothetical protein
MTGDDTGQQSLEEQAKSLIDEGTDAEELVEELDLDTLEELDQYAAWHASTPFQPMVRALLLKELKDWSHSELHRFLTENKKTAWELGFDKIPSRSTFSRTWRDRFDEELRSYLSEQAMAIAGIAWQQASNIVLQSLEPEDKSGSSDRTKDRYISKKAKNVTEELQRLVYPCFDFDRRDTIQYEKNQFLNLQSHLGLSHSAAESGSDLYADNVGYEEAPDADTHLYNIKRLTPEKVLNAILEHQSELTEPEEAQTV